MNAFIRGIDRLANARLPAAVLTCTDRLSALDPTVRRRAAEVLSFTRRADDQRCYVLSTRLKLFGLGKGDPDALVEATGKKEREFGFTFSDLTQRLVPSIIFDAYPYQAVNGHRAVELARAMATPPPFRDNAT